MPLSDFNADFSSDFGSDVVLGADWPAALPQAFLLDTFQQTLPDTLLRTQPEAGPAIVRRRFSTATTPVSGEMFMTAAQRATFTEFWTETIAYGSAQFEFPAQIGTGTWTVRLTAPPVFRPVAAYWRVALEMEILP